MLVDEEHYHTGKGEGEGKFGVGVDEGVAGKWNIMQWGMCEGDNQVLGYHLRCE